MTSLDRSRIAVAALVATFALSACTSVETAPTPGLALGEGHVAPAGDGVEMAFAIEDVRTGTADDLSGMGLSNPMLDEGQSAFFITYSIALESGDIADMDPEALVEASEWAVGGEGAYREIEPLGGSFDCTVDGTATRFVAPDAPLVGCIAFIGPSDALPTVVEVPSIDERWSLQA